MRYKKWAHLMWNDLEVAIRGGVMGVAVRGGVMGVAVRVV